MDNSDIKFFSSLEKGFAMHESPLSLFHARSRFLFSRLSEHTWYIIFHFIPTQVYKIYQICYLHFSISIDFSICCWYAAYAIPFIYVFILWCWIFVLWFLSADHPAWHATWHAIFSNLILSLFFALSMWL